MMSKQAPTSLAALSMQRALSFSPEVARLRDELDLACDNNRWWAKAIQETGREGIEPKSVAPATDGQQGLLLVGGTGARLSPMTENLNKHLLPVGGQPMCFYPLANLISAGVKDLWVSTSARDLAVFQALLGSGEQFGISINYHIQRGARGVALAIGNAFQLLGDRPAMVALGDGVFVGDARMDFIQSLSFDRGARMPMFDMPEAQRYECVEFSSQGKPVDFHEKPTVSPSGTVIGGIYILDPRAKDFAANAPESPRGEYDVNAINRGFRDKGDIHLVPLPRGMRYFDAGQFETLGELAGIFEGVTPHQRMATYSPHIAAYRRGNISEKSLVEYCESQPAPSQYFSDVLAYVGDSRRSNSSLNP